MPQEREEYRIGQLAKLADVKPDTVRFYERPGLLDKPRRNPNGYRSYRKATLYEIRFIRKAQSLGFSLDEVGSSACAGAGGRPVVTSSPLQRPRFRRPRQS